jgi:uncharacterized protein (TIGR03437 family)
MLASYKLSLILRLCALLLAGLPLAAQFAELASTDDGRQLYFSSTLQFAGKVADRGETRIYRVAEDGISLFAERGPLGSLNSFSSGFGARSPQVSGDGQTVGLTLRDICPNETPCITTVNRVEVRGRYNRVLGTGSLALSRNGRWALAIPAGGPLIPGFTSTATRINLETGDFVPVPLPPIGAPLVLASDGSLLVQTGLWRDGSVTPFTLFGPAALWGISDNAKTLIYRAISSPSDNPRQQIVARNLATDRDVVLDSRLIADGIGLPLGLSNDGQWLLYRVLKPSANEGPAFLANTSTGESTPLALPSGELVVDGTLSGNGNWIFLVTTRGRIVRISRQGNEVATLVPATPYMSLPLSGVSPGSFIKVAATFSGMPVDDLRGRIFLNDQPLPVMFSGAELGLQVPWEVNLSGEALFHMDIVTGSPFLQRQLVAIASMAPAFLPADPGVPSALGFKAVRGDFSGVLTSAPKPGEIFVIYATGLGPVQGTPRSGEPTPQDRLFPITGVFHCRFFPYTTEAETLYAGLAPGTTGIYQVNFRMPQGPDLGAITGGSCSYGLTGQSSGGLIWYRAVLPSPAP